MSLLKVNSVYEIRAGGAISSYFERSNVYRFFFRSVLRNATYVLCQGEEYLGFVEEIAPNKSFYYPNFIDANDIKPYSNLKRNESLSIVYFGRIAPSKNIDFLLEVCKALKTDDFNCEIIGGGDLEFINVLTQKIIINGLEDKIKISPPQKSIQLFENLLTKHFFLFPTIEKREGHSNSLTEAMAHGVVPIVSDVGFNKSVIKNDFLVIEQFNPIDYANKIEEVWGSESWQKYSEYCYNLVMHNYITDKVKNELFKVHYRE